MKLGLGYLDYEIFYYSAMGTVGVGHVDFQGLSSIFGTALL